MSAIDEPRLLHVDDDPAVLDLTAAFLDRELDWAVTTVTETSVDTALEWLRREPFDCVISDYDMPEMDGLAFFDVVRDRDVGAPFILYTGKGSEEIASQALNAGVTGYFQKGGPDQQRRLANRVGQAIEESRTKTVADRYSTVMEALGYPIYVVDEDGRFEFVNEPFAELTGYDVSTIVGSKPGLIKDDDAVERASDELGSILSSEGPPISRFEVDIVPKEGEPIRCRDHMAALPYDGECFEGSVGILRDVSAERRRARELERRTRAMDEAPIGITMSDPSKPDTPPDLRQRPVPRDDGVRSRGDTRASLSVPPGHRYRRRLGRRASCGRRRRRVRDDHDPHRAARGRGVPEPGEPHASPRRGRRRRPLGGFSRGRHRPVIRTRRRPHAPVRAAILSALRRRISGPRAGRSKSGVRGGEEEPHQHLPEHSEAGRRPEPSVDAGGQQADERPGDHRDGHHDGHGRHHGARSRLLRPEGHRQRGGVGRGNGHDPDRGLGPRTRQPGGVRRRRRRRQERPYRCAGARRLHRGRYPTRHRRRDAGRVREGDRQPRADSRGRGRVRRPGHHERRNPWRERSRGSGGERTEPRRQRRPGGDRRATTEEYDLDAGPDPATFAAAEPEPPRAALDDPAYAVGIGPGNPAYLTRRGARAIHEADVVVGFETVVDFVADETEADLLTCGYADEAATLETFARRIREGHRGTAVLMGDPNHSGYQFLGKVERAVDVSVTVVPGVSSLQVAASRARTPMENAAFVTLHRSGDRHLLVLPRPFDWMPGDVADLLVDSGADPDLDALVLERLAHDDERVTRTTLGDLRGSAGGSDRESTPYSDLSVLVMRTEGA